MSSKLHIVILAAGKGSRMRSALPKVLHQLAGKTLLDHVISTSRELNPDNICVVYGHAGEQVLEKFTEQKDIAWSEQKQQLGTGHALQVALPNLSDEGTVLVLYGDVPLTSTATLQALIEKADENSVALLTAKVEDPTGYGRIKRDEKNNVSAIVEHKDASTEELNINEINTGILALPANQLSKWLAQISNDNAQGEYYLTDIIALAVSSGVAVKTNCPTNSYETLGVNNRMQLAECERYYQAQQADNLMMNGVTLSDPARLDIRGKLTAGQDCFIDINCIFIGECEIGDNVSIAANCIIENSRIASGTKILANTIIEDSDIGAEVTVGPFARIRPGSLLADKSKVGNFVEIKKTSLGKGSKVNHLSYVGDAELGKDVNVGAGTITCNYDGANKHQTIIEDNSFIGSNSALVAPVIIAEGSTIGAGSVINSNTEKNTLTVSRAKQKTFSNWQRPSKNKKSVKDK